MKFRKKPIEVEAVQITSGMMNGAPLPPCVVIKELPWRGDESGELELKHGPHQGFFLDTPFMITPVELGDWIVTTEDGEVYPCQDKVFRRIYEPIPKTEDKK